MVTAFRESFHDERTQIYRPWMDQYAADFRGNGDYTPPGEMVYWPLNAPRHNVEQLQLCIGTAAFSR